MSKQIIHNFKIDCICPLVVFYMNEYARPKQIPQVASQYCTDISIRVRDKNHIQIINM